MRPAVCALLLCLLGLVTAAPARGDEARERARHLFDESAEHYRAGRFDRAIELLEEAHRLSGEPVLLFNLAKAYEGKGDLENAIAAYERYLREATAVPDRGAIERRIATLRDQLRQRSTLERDVESERRRAEAERRRAAEAGRNKPSPVPWVVAGVGAAGLAAGAALGALAKGKESDAASEPVQLDAAELADEAETLAIGANLAFAFGGALALGGLTWGIVDVVTSDCEPPASARVEIRPGMARLVVVLP